MSLKITITYSEADMANSFKKALLKRRNLPGIGRMEVLAEEIDCYQGRPDFLTLSRRVELSGFQAPSKWKLAIYELLTLLKPKSPRTVSFLKAKSGYSDDKLSKLLHIMHTGEFIERVNEYSYKLGKNFFIRDIDLIAFELKLRDHKKAIFQAKQARNYACKAIIVVPPCQVKQYDKYDEVMKRWGIGLVSFDPVTNRFIVVKKVKKNKPLSNYDYLNTLLQMMHKVYHEITI